MSKKVPAKKAAKPSKKPAAPAGDVTQPVPVDKELLAKSAKEPEYVDGDPCKVCGNLKWKKTPAGVQCEVDGSLQP